MTHRAIRMTAMGAALAAAITVACHRADRPAERRVIVLGFDGLDYSVTRDLIDRGRLPHFARLAGTGSFNPLGTSIPPQSPVAWSTFITGADPGVHGIFDFVHRDPRTMEPYLSTTRTHDAERTLDVGRWRIPLSGGRVELLRRGEPFWEVLEEHGVATTIVRMPANFPPSGTASHELSGMGTPDVLGTYGTFSFHTSAPPSDASTASGGIVRPVTVSRDVVRGELEGPDNPFLVKREQLRLPFAAYVDADAQHVKLVVGDEERLLGVGEWSDWIPLEFELIATERLRASCRVFLKQIQPTFELYVSPLNIDPIAPALPVSTPEHYAGDLARATGRFYTQGMPEDTKALRAGVLTVDQFLQQARIAADENIRQFQHVLATFEEGFLFYYFGNVDQVSHMMWRARDAEHPGYDPRVDRQYAATVDELYTQLDAVVGDTLARLGPDDLLVVMSDHGFTSWRRSFHLNNWLRDNGYLTAASSTDDQAVLGDIDWSSTRAYALGLNGLYLNLEGREAHGIVEPADRRRLLEDIAAKLLAVIDPATGERAITKVYRREDVYSSRAHDDIAPDLVIGYAKGTRSSDESALGELSDDVFTTNRDPWSGDHCMDHETVPGILLTSRPLRRPAPTLQSLAAALVAEFGIQDFPRSQED